MKKTSISKVARVAFITGGLAIAGVSLAACGTSNGGGGGASPEPYSPPPTSAPRGSH